MLIFSFTVYAQDHPSGLFDDLTEFAPNSAPEVTPPQTTPPNPPPTPTDSSVRPVKPEADIIQLAPLTPEELERYLEQGKAAYAEKDWDRSQKQFETVLSSDPYNARAIRWLHRIANKKEARELKSYETTRSRMLEQVQAAWNAPKAEGDSLNRTEASHPPTENELRTEALRHRLETLQIPSITFQDATIQQVVLELSALLRSLDPQQKGVNLVVFGAHETLLPPVTFSGTDLSALETLDLITQMSGMKYDIGPNRISLTPVNYEPPQQMVSTEFDIIESVGNKMESLLGEQAQTSGLLDVREFFCTIPFPPSSSAQYNTEFNLLLIRNVPKHIEAVERLLHRYNRKALEERTQQVEIETKFIEISEGALEELGFEWTVGAAGTFINHDQWSVPGGQKMFTDTLRSGQEAFGATLPTAGKASSFSRYAAAVADPTGAALVGTAGELLIQRISDEVPINLVIRALERQAGSDMLSAPKVLTRSGETATIHVGEIHWFPTAYDVVIERYAQPSLVPLDYEKYKTGVLLEVTPVLDAANGIIDLTLSPEICELAGFDEQHVSTIWPEFGDEDLTIFRDANMSLGDSYTDGVINFLTAREENRTINADRLIAHRPVFRTRKVETMVTIQDGSTIVMGGLIKEKLETFKDSVPILGKIPLLGRLFRSEGEQTVKRNLMIFVTANQVNAAGHRKSIR